MINVWFQQYDSPLGPMIAGTTERGVCFQEWEDRGGADRIKTRVIKRYRCELIEKPHPHLTLLKKQMAEYFGGERTTFDIPVDVTGTTFEQTVWTELQAIPYGVTRAYGEMATLIGKPGAARAVGRANGANYLNIIIPCHRVIEANGNLRGYGGKLWRKKWLLDLESGQRALSVA
jgi:AraC family transcriptional regulator of adaptative response/methylated-DNA-[protein]-cysteine methyltransferase